ncbi:D(1) dopamine receptor-like [Ruditapes philippinarum]|uniref:D(1) dopamine receptor-like n=1 Tax=Ruditapes philippinarum TaxID=129788 RepID=UPI00295AA62A|nr:D(1) dopamine receptor-like [Ruditapes philippinarum]
MDSDDNITNEKLARQLKYDFQEAVLPVTVFVGIEVVVGFFGNLLVIYVFLFRYHVCNFRYFVLCMAFVDFASTLTTMPGEMVTQMYWYIYPYRLMCKINTFFNVFTAAAEILCLLIIAIDRYRKVCTPFGWQIQPKMALFLCGVVYFVAFIIALPVPFFWGIHTAKYEYKNQTVNVTVCEKDGEYNKTDHPLKYSYSVQGIISVCLISMFGLYILIARKLITGKGGVNGKSDNKAIAITSIKTGASSDVNIKKDTELSSKQDTSDAGYSSGVGNKPKKAKFNYISSDGGLTTDEDEDSSSRITTLSTPEVSFAISKNDKKSANTIKSHALRRKRFVGLRVRRKTKIMLILTILFIITIILYSTLLSFIAKNILKDMSGGSKTVYFFFFRLYFINHVINPFLYGFLDPHFKKVMIKLKDRICSRK